ncbi:exported [Chlorella sorokiniana]|uniref:Exported n=1 Tax=Chlorella sorokiniana TaxID=3076 RepID=A0A2P6TCK8_CHLSO|nr:exported [Chlorella sorokiniana]|eukprot:PRW20393.1 exported [Chlorella sorokiniana]
MRAHLALAALLLAGAAWSAAAINLSAGQRCALSLQPLVTTRGACDIPSDSKICPDACLAALMEIKNVADQDCLKELAKVSPASKDRAEHAAAVCLQQLPGMSPLPADAQLVIGSTSGSTNTDGTTTTGAASGDTNANAGASANGDSKPPSGAGALRSMAGVVLSAALAALLLA